MFVSARQTLISKYINQLVTVTATVGAHAMSKTKQVYLILKLIHGMFVILAELTGLSSGW